MKEGWRITKLGAISEIFRGGSPRPIKSFITQEADGVNWIKIGDTEVGGKYIYSTEEKIRKEGMRSSRYVEPGDFLLSNSMSFGRPYILRTDGCIHDGWLVIKKYERTLVQDFLYYLLLSPVVAKQFEEGARGSTVRNLNTDIVSSVVVSYPVSHIEQQRIVDILDQEFAKIDVLKTNAEKSLQAAKDLFQATLKKELEPREGWNHKRLDEICSITAELIDPTLPGYLNQIHIGGANIVAETGALIDLKTAQEEKLISGKFPFDETMVLYSKIRPYLKKVCCPEFSGICSADIYPLKPNAGYDRTFLYYILLSNDFTDYAILGSARAGMPKVNRPYLFAYSCFVPDYDEQCSIASRLNTIREHTHTLQENYQKTLSLCDDLKQALLRKAFNGEL